MPLVHKSLAVRPEVWQRLRINAALSGVAVRDFMTYLIENTPPVAAEDTLQRGRLAHSCRDNASAVQRMKIMK